MGNLFQTFGKNLSAKSASGWNSFSPFFIVWSEINQLGGTALCTQTTTGGSSFSSLSSAAADAASTVTATARTTVAARTIAVVPITAAAATTAAATKSAQRQKGDGKTPGRISPGSFVLHFGENGSMDKSSE